MSLNKRTAQVATEWWRARLMSGDKTKFASSLKASIEAGLENNGRIGIECDYDPKGVLLDAVRAAGLECAGVTFSADGILPKKHATAITPGRIEPKEGYGNWTDPIEVE